MTVADQITRVLSKAQHPMTSKEIAKKIGRPRPSVRRTLLALEGAGNVRIDWSAVDSDKPYSSLYWMYSSGF